MLAASIAHGNRAALIGPRLMPRQIINSIPLPAQFLGLLTREELAAELKCSPRHIQRLTRARVIPMIVISRHCLRYRREAVLRALVSREQEATAP